MDNILKNFILSGPDIPRPEGLTDTDIRVHTDSLINHYEELISSGWENVRVHECEAYLEILQQVRSVNYQWDRMGKLGKHEIVDEYYCINGE